MAHHEPLPAQTQLRLIAIVQRSAPDPNRPQLEPETERRFEGVERRTAACYASLEEASTQLSQIAKRITDKLRSG